MKYVKIKGKNYNDALMQLRMQYGDDAIPISSKNIKEGGLFNTKFMAHDVTEVTAAIKEDKPKSYAQSMAGMGTAASLSSAARTVDAQKSVPKRSTFDVLVGADVDVTKSVLSGGPEPERNPAYDTFTSSASRTAARPAAQNQSAPLTGSAPLSPATPRKDAAIELTTEEYRALKKFEKDFYALQDTLDRMKRTEGQTASSSVEIDPVLKPYFEMLKSNDFDDAKTTSVIDNIKSTMSAEDLKDSFKIEKTLKELLKSKIVTTGPIKSSGRKKIIMLIGPTGVGKTTSLAKLGAIFALRESKKVAFITIDTYRIAATEQLKKYAEIMRIPLHVVSDQKQFKSVIENEKADIILVDTSGRSYRNELKISEIKSYADQIDYDFEKILCVSASTKKDDVNSIFNAFEKINYNSVMITKVDETSFVGNIINVADTYNKPISYFTTGQEVPNDIDVADPEKIVNMMVGAQ